MADPLPSPGDVLKLSGRVGGHGFTLVILWNDVDRRWAEREAEVAVGTQVEVLEIRRDPKMDMVRVRVLEGPNQGKTGWIRAAFAEEERSDADS